MQVNDRYKDLNSLVKESIPCSYKIFVTTKKEPIIYRAKSPPKELVLTSDKDFIKYKDFKAPETSIKAKYINLSMPNSPTRRAVQSDRKPCLMKYGEKTLRH